MVATVLSLKWRTTVHQLRREWWRVLVLVGGIAWSASLIPTVLWARFNLSYAPLEARTTALVMITAVLSLGWLVVPVLITGLDDTLDPGRFASLGVSARRLMPGLTVAQFLTVPALFMVATLVTLATSWRPWRGNYVPVTWAVIGALLSVSVMVIAARVAVMWVARLLGSRKGRTAAGVMAGTGVIALLGLAIGMISQGLEGVLEYAFPALVRGLSTTPLGAGGALGELALREQWDAVAWRVAMLTGVVVVLHRAWKHSVEHALVNPSHRGGGQRRRNDAVLGAAERAAASTRRFTMPQAQRAVVERQRRYWSSDPRYLVSLSGVVAFPLLYVVLAMTAFGLDAAWAYVAPLLLAASIGWGRHNDVAFDSTAMWIDVAAGRLGVEIMRGRMIAVAMWAVPAVAVSVLAVAAVTREWAWFAPVMGAAMGVLGVTLGVSAVTSVLLPYRAPAPGENPFSAEVGSVGASLAAQLLSSLMAATVMPFVTVPLILAVVVDPAWAWVSVATGFILGPAGLHWGATAAGTLYNQRSGKLLTAVT